MTTTSRTGFDIVVFREKYEGGGIDQLVREAMQIMSTAFDLTFSIDCTCWSRPPAYTRAVVKLIRLAERLFEIEPSSQSPFLY